MLALASFLSLLLLRFRLGDLLADLEAGLVVVGGGDERELGDGIERGVLQAHAHAAEFVDSHLQLRELGGQGADRIDEDERLREVLLFLKINFFGELLVQPADHFLEFLGVGPDDLVLFLDALLLAVGEEFMHHGFRPAASPVGGPWPNFDVHVLFPVETGAELEQILALEFTAIGIDAERPRRARHDLGLGELGDKSGETTVFVKLVGIEGTGLVFEVDQRVRIVDRLGKDVVGEPGGQREADQEHHEPGMLRGDRDVEKDVVQREGRLLRSWNHGDGRKMGRSAGAGAKSTESVAEPAA